MKRLARLVVLPLLVLGYAAPARAEDPPVRHEPTASDLATARAALKEGLALRERGDNEAAFMRFSTAYDIVQTPVTAFELGKAHMILGRILQAHELFVKIGRMPRAMEESDRSAASREEAGRLARSLEPRIPTLRIHLKLPQGAVCTLRVDDDVVTATGETTPRSVDPGKHEIGAKAGDGPEEKVTVQIGESEVKDVELSPQWIPPKPKPATPTGQVVLVKQTNPLVFIGFGAASASLVATGVFGILAVNAAARAQDRCGHDYCSQKVRQDDVGPAGGFGLATLIAGGATLGFIVMGVVSISNPVKEKYTTKLQPMVGPTSAGLSGTF